MKDNELPIKPDTVNRLLETITPDIYSRLKTAVEIGKWETGDKLSIAQIENAMQLIIAYESRYLSVSERVGYLATAKKKPPCETDTKPLTVKEKH